MAPPRPRIKLLLFLLGVVGTAVAAWVYVPDVPEAAQVLWGDVKEEALSPGGPAP